MSNFKLMQVLQLMKSMADGISDTIYTSERPKSIAENLSDFIVVSLPVMIYDRLVGTGTDYGMMNSYCRFEIFVRDVGGVENTPKLTRMAEELLDAFPVSESGILITRPRVAMKGSDEHDFHLITIQASLLIS